MLYTSVQSILWFLGAVIKPMNSEPLARFSWQYSKKTEPSASAWLSNFLVSRGSLYSFLARNGARFKAAWPEVVEAASHQLVSVRRPVAHGEAE